MGSIPSLVQDDPNLEHLVVMLNDLILSDTGNGSFHASVPVLSRLRIHEVHHEERMNDSAVPQDHLVGHAPLDAPHQGEGSPAGARGPAGDPDVLDLVADQWHCQISHISNKQLAAAAIWHPLALFIHDLQDRGISGDMQSFVSLTLLHFERGLSAGVPVEDLAAERLFDGCPMLRIERLGGSEHGPNTR